MVTEFVLIPKHKYEQLEKDAAPKDGNLSTPLLSPPSDDTAHTTVNNDNPPNLSHDDELGPDGETISNADDDDDNDYDVSDVLESFNSTIITLVENNTDVLTWNRKTGEIVFLQQLVQDSNVIELVKDTLTANLHPVAKMEFYRGFYKSKIILY